MKSLKDILYGVAIVEVVGDTSIELTGIAFDSRKVAEGFCYIAQVGTQVDGHNYIDQSIKSGANAVLCENLPSACAEGISYIVVKNSGEALGIMASNFLQ